MLTARRPPSDFTDDPLTLAMRPPETETETERRDRLLREAEAKRISEAIDEELRAERKNWDKKRQDIRLLLLGQAESGKSTLQKQFQLIYNPDSLEQERASWKSVVYLNIVRSVKLILETLDTYGDNADNESPEASDASSSGHTAPRRPRAQSVKRVGTSGNNSGTSGSPSSPSSSKVALAVESQRVITMLRLRLSPLVAFEATLANRLSGGMTNAGASSNSKLVARRGWQSLASLNAPSRRNGGPRVGADGAVRRASVDGSGDVVGIVEELASVLNACKDEVHALWTNEAVQKLIAKRRLRLEDSAEYFLKDTSRIADRGYVPSVDDILHARIQTMGVAEHQFEVPLHGKMVTWHLYDVGGARGQRHTWIPYFDDANAIIFVAPVSAFDQYLEEDPRTNRIDDSLQLFTAICSNQLLKNVHLVLFLNKVDLLQTKLASGIQVKKYITSFGDRSNDYETAVSYFRAHFNQVYRKTNEKKRVLYTHLTSVVDTTTTRSIIANVRDSIFRDYLKSAALV